MGQYHLAFLHATSLLHRVTQTVDLADAAEGLLYGPE